MGRTRELTEEKARRFAEIYVFETFGNASAAFKQMYEELGLELPSSIRRQASEYLNQPKVLRHVEHFRKVAREQYAVDKDEIVSRLKELAFDRDKSDKTALAALKQLTDMGGFAQQNINLNATQEYKVVIE